MSNIEPKQFYRHSETIRRYKLFKHEIPMLEDRKYFDSNIRIHFSMLEHRKSFDSNIRIHFSITLIKHEIPFDSRNQILKLDTIIRIMKFLQSEKSIKKNA